MSARNPSLTLISTVLTPATPLFAGGQPVDLISLGEVKEELEITNTQSDSWLKKRITAASYAASNYCNRVFQVQTYQDQIWASRDPYPWQLPGGMEPLQLRAFPIASPPSPALVPPPQTPVLSTGSSGVSALAYVRITYVSPLGESAASQESVILSSGGSVTVAAPGADPTGRAIGWNCYVASASGAEALQNASPIGVNSSFTATTPFLAGAPPPNYLLAVSNAQPPQVAATAPTTGTPQPLCEGIDFRADRNHGWLERLDANGYVRAWAGVPILVQYQAGYPVIPVDIADAVLLMVKGRWFGRQRDPLIRSENAVGNYEAAYFFGTGPGGQGDLPVDAMAKLDRYRVPVVA